MKIDENTKLQKAKNVHWKSVNGEAVLLHFTSGDYYALDSVGTFLWSKINEQPRAFEELLNCLEMEYNCSKEQANKDLKDFCNSLVAEKLLEFTSGAVN